MDGTVSCFHIEVTLDDLVHNYRDFAAVYDLAERKILKSRHGLDFDIEVRVSGYNTETNVIILQPIFHLFEDEEDW